MEKPRYTTALEALCAVLSGEDRQAIEKLTDEERAKGPVIMEGLRAMFKDSPWVTPPDKTKELADSGSGEEQARRKETVEAAREAIDAVLRKNGVQE